MIGNVWEWAEDDWHDSYTGAPANGSAWIDSPRGSSRVLRGGSWYDTYSELLRASVRYGDPSVRADGIGFRCAGSQ